MSQEAGSSWSERYQANAIGWDLGTISPPLQAYFEQLDNKGLATLIPGAGNAHEAEYLHRAGFNSVHVADIAKEPLVRLKEVCPTFPDEHIHHTDIFDHTGSYELIIEQTFFCALDPKLRSRYVDLMWKFLKPKGKLVGLLFDAELYHDRPPYGGSEKEYRELFNERFHLNKMESANNSIEERAGQELWINLSKKV